ncbi:MAG: RNA polymerase factor sigma-54 [Deltaproteobacteria bacterium]|nr:RNA polymerase factor sigma-54 [Deltaproteobacteria bacterium]
MGLELKQSLKLSQQLVMTPQLQQAIRLLQLSRMELEQEIAVEMEQNPALEIAAETAEEQLAEKAPGEASLEAENIEAPAQSEAQNNTSADVTEVTSETKTADIDWEQYLESYQTLGHTAPVVRDAGSEDMPGYEATLTKKESLSDHLLEQLSMLELTEEEQRVGQEIIGNIDEHGYFRLEGTEGDPLIAVASVCGVSIECGEKVLRLIQGFDPQGVGSRDLQECLLVQAKHLKQDAHLVATIIKHHMKHLETNNIPAIARELKCSTGDIARAVKVISEMEPRPGRNFVTEEPQYITPDIYVHKMGDKYVPVLNDDGLSKLRVSRTYSSALKSGQLSDPDAKKYIEKKLESARWLVRSIHQRQRTIYKVTESIVKFQREFFEKGISHLKPLILKDVADDIGMHESTVSRVTTNKYVHTPQGIYELKFFFNSSIARTGGDEIASEAVKNHIKQIVGGEPTDNPYSDQKIVELLKVQGIEIARRTVAKYRDVLGILPSSKRKKYT